MTDQRQSNGSPKPGDTPDPAQIDLLDQAQIHPCPAHRGRCGYAGGPLTQAFFAFAAANPNVVRRMAADMRTFLAETGRRESSIQTFIERVRWEAEVIQKVGEFRVANAHAAFYARWLLTADEFWGMFDLAVAPEADEWVRHIGGHDAVTWQQLKRDRRKNSKRAA